jgi:hypothetical protein
MIHEPAKYFRWGQKKSPNKEQMNELSEKNQKIAPKAS